ncbi:MAG: copper-binding protein [Rhodospirillales bacterium]|nr:MAG: copper-binding protein [Rhodospirillales bacterium]
MRKLILAAAVVAALAVPAAAVHAQTAPTPATGEVTKIDAAAGKITMRHGPIKNLDMDSMTMVFRVGDPAMLATVKPGDKVVFEAERVNGQITVTRIRKSP